MSPAVSPEPRPAGSHLAPAAAAVGTVVLAFLAAHLLVHFLLPSRMAGFASRLSPVRLTGNTLQTRAFELRGVLPIYGSSELNHHSPNRPDIFFRQRPTGFSVFPVGHSGTSTLVLLQKLAAAGRVVRGHPVAVFLSPSWFAKDEMPRNAAQVNLAAPQLGAWLFDGALPWRLKGRIARRMEDYSVSYRDQPLIAEAVRCLAQPEPGSRLVFDSLVPLGKLQNVVFGALEDVAILDEMQRDQRPAHVPHRPAHEPGVAAQPMIPTEALSGGEPRWDRLAREAEAEDLAHGDGTRYSATTRFDAKDRSDRPLPLSPPGSKDGDYLKKLDQSAEWTDLVLLMEVLRSLKARPLFISQPFNGVFNDLTGVSERARRAYYDKLRQVVAPYNIPLADFADHEQDRMFFNDSNHPSGKGWIYYDRALDHFYRGLKE